MATKNSSLTPEELCAILKACGDAKVAEMDFGTLHVRFDRPDQKPLPNPGIAVSDDTLKQVTERVLREDEHRLREDQMALLQIENPLAAEQLALEDEGLSVN